MLYFVSLADNWPGGSWRGAVLVDAPSQKDAEALAVTLLAAQTGRTTPIQTHLSEMRRGWTPPEGSVGVVCTKPEQLKEMFGGSVQRVEAVGLFRAGR